MSLVRRLLAQMDMHHAGAGVEGRPGLTRHFLRGYRNMMLFRVGQHAVQRAGDDSLVAHGSAFNRFRSSGALAMFAAVLASTRYRRFQPPSGPSLAVGAKHARIAAVDREIS